MNRAVVFFIAGFFVLNIASGIRAEETTAQFGRFGKIALYHPSAHPAHLVLFVSGDGGWNLGVVDMARELAALDALVVGIDITYYLKQLENSSESCVYPAVDFELLSKFVQKKLGFPQYITPVLIGYSSGATLVYAAIVQAPSNTFRGAISLGFCPDIALSKPFCRGSGLEWTKGSQGKGWSFLPATRLAVPWVALQGTIDQVCDAEKTRDYVKHLSFISAAGLGLSQKRRFPQCRRSPNWIVPACFVSTGSRKRTVSAPIFRETILKKSRYPGPIISEAIMLKSLKPL